MLPAWRSTIAVRASARPWPVPIPTGLVVKNGSNTRSWIVAGIPVPVSAIVTNTTSPRSERVVIVIVPRWRWHSARSAARLAGEPARKRFAGVLEHDTGATGVADQRVRRNHAGTTQLGQEGILLLHAAQRLAAAHRLERLLEDQHGAVGDAHDLFDVRSKAGIELLCGVVARKLVPHR